MMVGLGIPFNSIRVVRSSARVDRGMMYGINRGGGVPRLDLVWENHTELFLEPSVMGVRIEATWGKW